MDPGAAGAPDHETKFVLDGARRRTIERWLELRCAPHPLHPAYAVRTIYLDTPRRRCLGETANGDLLKSKFRLRWYADRLTGVPTSGVHLEVKHKHGRLRGKIRLPVDVSPDELASTELHALTRPDVAAVLHREGLDAPSPLSAVLRIDYQRLRFLHAASGAQLCLDYDIHVAAINRRLVPRHDPRCLPEAVFEIKGRAPRVAAELCFLTRLGCRRQSFSKYLTCYRRVSGMID